MKRGAYALDAIKLHKKIYEKGLSISRVSRLSGIDVFYLHDVIFGTRMITIGDAIVLKRILEISDEEAVDIFLGGDNT